MEEAIRRIKNVNLDHLGTKIQSSGHTINLLEMIVGDSRQGTRPPTSSRPYNPGNCQKCGMLSTSLNKCYRQLQSLKRSFIDFNLTELVDMYQRQLDSVFTDMSKFCSGLLSAKENTISTLVNSIQCQSSKVVKLQQLINLKANTWTIPQIKQSKAVQTQTSHQEYIMYSKQPGAQNAKVQLNRCMFSHQTRLKSEETKADQSLFNIPRNKTRVNQANQSTVLSKENNKPKSNIQTRPSSVQQHFPLRQKEFMKLAYNHYVESGKMRQLNPQELESKVRSKYRSDYKGKHTLMLTEGGKPTVPKKFDSHK